MHCRIRIGIGHAGIDVFRRCRIGFLGILLGDLGVCLCLDIVATGKGGGNCTKRQRAGIRDGRKRDRPVVIGLDLLIDRKSFRLGVAVLDLVVAFARTDASAETMKVPLFTNLAVAEAVAIDLLIESGRVCVGIGFLTLGDCFGADEHKPVIGMFSHGHIDIIDRLLDADGLCLGFADLVVAGGDSRGMEPQPR